MNNPLLYLLLLILSFNANWRINATNLDKLWQPVQESKIRGRILYFADSSAFPGVMIQINNDFVCNSEQNGQFEMTINNQKIDSVKIEAIGCIPLTFINIPTDVVIDLDSIFLFDAIDTTNIVVYVDRKWWQFSQRKSLYKRIYNEQIERSKYVLERLKNYRFNLNGFEYSYDLTNNIIDLKKPINPSYFPE